MTSNKMMFHVIALAVFCAALLLWYAFRPAKLKDSSRKGGETFSFTLTGIWQYVKDRKSTLVLYLPEVFLVLFFIGGLITWRVSPYGDMLNRDNQSAMWFGDGRFDGLLFLFSYALLYVLVSHFGAFRTWYVKAFCFVLFAMCLITVWQLSGHNFMEFYPASSYNGYFNNFVSTIGNVDIMGGFLCTAVPLVGVGYIALTLNKFFSAVFLLCHTLSIYVMFSIGVDVTVIALPALIVIFVPLLFGNKQYALKTLEIGVSIVLGVWFSTLVDYQYIAEQKHTYTVFANSRFTPLAVGLIAVLVALWFLLQCFDLPKWLNWKRLQWGLFGAEVLLAIAVFVYFRFIFTPAQEAGLMRDLYNLVRFDLPDEAGTHRIGIWRHCFMMCKDHLWFGTGCGTLAETFRAFAYKTNYARYANKNRRLDFAHNEYIHYLCTQGVWGALSYLGFLASVFTLAFMHMKNNPKILILTAATLGFCIQVFFSFSVIIVAPFFWLLLGLLMKEVRTAAKQVA